MLNLRPPVPGAAVRATKAGVRPYPSPPQAAPSPGMGDAKLQRRAPGQVHLKPGDDPAQKRPKLGSVRPSPHGLSPSEVYRQLTLHPVPQLLALLGLGRLGVGVWPVGLARGRPCLAVLCGWRCSRLGAAVQSMSPMRGVGGLRGLGCWQLLGGCLVGHAFFHARDWGLVEEAGAEGRSRAPCALTLSSHSHRPHTHRIA